MPLIQICPSPTIPTRTLSIDREYIRVRIHNADIAFMRIFGHREIPVRQRSFRRIWIPRQQVANPSAHVSLPEVVTSSGGGAIMDGFMSAATSGRANPAQDMAAAPSP